MAVILDPAAAQPYFTAVELRDTVPELGDRDDATLDELRRLVEESLEEACGRAFVPRERTETATVRTYGQIPLERHDPREVLAVTVDGQAMTADLAAYRLGWGRVYNAPVARGQRVEVTYRHGMTAVPLRVRRAAMILAKVWGLPGPVDERVTQVRVGEDAVANLTTSGFGVSEINHVVQHYRVRHLGGIS